MKKAIKIRLYPSAEQTIYLGKLFGCSRFVYNKCLDYKITKYTETKESVSSSELSKYLTHNLKQEFVWINESHSKVLQQTLRNLDNAFQKFFKEKSGFPKFKSKHGSSDSVRFPYDAISSVKGNRINITRQLSDIHFKCSKKDEKYLNKKQDSIISATLSKAKTGEYYFSILVDYDETLKQLKQTTKTIGLDLGIKDFVITSDGQKYDNLKLMKKYETQLEKLHRSLSSKVKGSKNKNKARIKLAKLHQKIHNKKEFYMHCIVNQLLSENQTIGIENLNVAEMIKNHRLAKSIQDVSWSRFTDILKYKAEWFNRTVIEVEQWFASTQLCNDCGFQNSKITLDDRTWVCPKCGVSHDRDINAAKNIEKEGLRLLDEMLLKIESEMLKDIGSSLDEPTIGLSSPEFMLQDSVAKATQ